MKEIAISSPKYGRHIVLLDDEDYEKVNQFKWHLYKGHNTFYAIHSEYTPRCETISLHRYILGLTDSKIFVDHKNHNGLDCQRENMRACTRAQNLMNQLPKKYNLLGFKGVCINKQKSRNYIVAHIRANGKQIHLGQFLTAELAAHAYDVAAIKYYGEFACLNFPGESQNHKEKT